MEITAIGIDLAKEGAQGRVKDWLSIATLGVAYLFPPLSFGGASIAIP